MHYIEHITRMQAIYDYLNRKLLYAILCDKINCRNQNHKLQLWSVLTKKGLNKHLSKFMCLKVWNPFRGKRSLYKLDFIRKMNLWNAPMLLSNTLRTLLIKNEQAMKATASNSRGRQRRKLHVCGNTVNIFIFDLVLHFYLC